MISKDDKWRRWLFWLPAKLYELAVRLRIAAYETAYLKPERLDSTVISIGNLTLGGTGKTPFVEYIARYLKGEGHSVAILTRGYSRRSRGRRVLNSPSNDAGKRDTQPDTASKDEKGGSPARVPADSYCEFGDEPVMLARALDDVPVIIDKNRFAAGMWARSELGSDVMVLDDGYQHLKLARDLNILLLDASDPFGGFEMVPFGRLREPLYGMRRADAVIVTRADRSFDQAQILTLIKLFCPDNVPVMYFQSVIARLRHLATGETYEAREFTGWNAALMCGIGNPHAFADDVLQIGINIVSENFFPDHHPFSQADLDRVNDEAREGGADAILVTEKDAVRLEGLNFGRVPVYAAQLEILSEDEVRLKSLLLRTVSSKGNDER